MRVVGDEDDGLTGRVQAAHELDDLLTSRGVERTGGLVRKQQRGFIRERPCDREALTLSAREHAGHHRRLVADAEQVQEVTRSRLSGLAVAAGDDGGQRHVLEHRHAFEQVEELKDDADMATPNERVVVFGTVGQGFARDDDRAFVGVFETRDEVEQR